MDANAWAIIITALGGAVAGIIAAYQKGLKTPSPDCTCQGDKAPKP